MPPYGGPGPGGYPPAYPVRGPEASSVRTQAIAALIVNIIATVFCCGLASIAGAIVAGVSLSRVDSDLPGARRLVAWSWGLLAANIVIAAIVIAVLVARVNSVNTT